MLRVGINGFGRIGRAVCRINLVKKYFNVVAINDINRSNQSLAYMLQYDSTYGRLRQKVQTVDKTIQIEDGDDIFVECKSRIGKVPWEKYDVDLIVDASGIYENLKDSKELREKGVKACVVTHSPDEVDKTVIVGLNEGELDLDKHFMISSSICDACAFASTINALNSKYGVDHGFVTTVHPWLQYQNLLDGPSRSYAYPGSVYENFALGRASVDSLIPKTTSCVRASEKILDFLNGKFQAFSYRVPTPIVSSADISVKLTKKTCVDEVVKFFQQKEKEQKYNIFYNNFEPLVSTDFIGSEYSAIIDHRWTAINKFNYLKLVLWYDNEWGYSCRVVDLVKYIEGKI